MSVDNPSEEKYNSSLEITLTVPDADVYQSIKLPTRLSENQLLGFYFLMIKGRHEFEARLKEFFEKAQKS